MADINISIGCAHYINVQAACALQQVQKSSELIDSACNLQQEAVEINQPMPMDWKLRWTFDNELMEKT